MTSIVLEALTINGSELSPSADPNFPLQWLHNKSGSMVEILGRCFESWYEETSIVSK